MLSTFNHTKTPGKTPKTTSCNISLLIFSLHQNFNIFPHFYCFPSPSSSSSTSSFLLFSLPLTFYCFPSSSSFTTSSSFLLFSFEKAKVKCNGLTLTFRPFRGKTIEMRRRRENNKNEEEEEEEEEGKQ